MAQINRIPIGYLDFLGNPTSGRTPPESADTVVPTVAMDSFYYAQTLAAVRQTLTHTTQFEFVEVVVPDGQLWILRTASVRDTFASTAYFDVWSFALDSLPREDLITVGGAPHFFFTRELRILATGDRDGDAIALPQPIPLSPGTVIRATLEERDNGGVARTALFNFLVTQLTI